ncbi:MAG: RICIN domain-containing protein, partial [Oscillospiraceae bacterium]|nr:RICIN domain-containing protein [Oscillospiraceae bacterium]
MQTIKKQTAIFLIICMVLAVCCPLFSHATVPAQAISTDYPVQLLRITNASDTADLTATGTADRSALALQSAAGTQSQNWRIAYVNTDSKGSFYKLYNMSNGRLLTPDYYSVTAGTSCVSFGAESTPEQHWYIIPVTQDKHGNDLYYKIVNYQDTNLALTGGSAGVTLESYTGAENQKWMLQSSGLQGFGGYGKDMQNQPKSSTIGGALGETVEVSTFDELKAACEDNVTKTIVITKNISKTASIRDYTTNYRGAYYYPDAYIYVRPNKTIIGSYAANALYNVYFRTSTSKGNGSNFILKNLTLSHDTELIEDNLMDFPCGINLWIDHITFVGHSALNTSSTGLADYDKFLCIYGNANFCSVSNCKFGYHEYGCLYGEPKDSDETYNSFQGTPCVTIDCNYYDSTFTRAPGLLRYGYYHALNNYVYNFSLGFTVYTASHLYNEAGYYDGSSQSGYLVNDRFGQAGDTASSTYKCQYAQSGCILENSNYSVEASNADKMTWRPSANYTYQTMPAADAKRYCTANAGAKSSREEMTYVTFAEKGMPSASYSTAADITMPSVKDEPKIGAVMDTSVKYRFKNAGSGLYLEVDGAKAENGANVQQWGADGFASHNSWKLIDAGDGYYYIRS